MADSFLALPRYIRQTVSGWEGADYQNGPWRPIPAPQPASALFERQPVPADPTPADRPPLWRAISD